MFFLKGGIGDPKTAAINQKSHFPQGFIVPLRLMSYIFYISTPPETLAVRTQERMKARIHIRDSGMPLLFHKGMPISRS